jgi:hypothetical protein
MRNLDTDFNLCANVRFIDYSIRRLPASAVQVTNATRGKRPLSVARHQLLAGSSFFQVGIRFPAH